MAVKKVRDAENTNTGEPNRDKTAEKLSEGSAKGQGAAEGAHFGKARRQLQEDIKYR